MSEGWTPEGSKRKVPYQVQQLARMVAYAFYGKEHGLIVDILCKHSSVKEDDLCDILKLEKKHFRNILQALKGDQIIASKQRITKDASDVSQRSFEYGLEFSSLLNLVKYKLDLMRRKLETEERTNANRASFTCSDCHKTFSDLEAGLLFDPFAGKMLCTICGSEVQEAAAAPEESQHVAMAKFNERLTPFFDLIVEIDSLDLSPEDLRSDFSDAPYDMSKAHGSGGHSNWSSDRSRGDYNYIPQAITINIGEAEVKQQKAREQPIWLTKSTIDTSDETVGTGVAVDTGAISATGAESSAKNDELLSMLMKHEKNVFEEEDRSRPTGHFPLSSASTDAALDDGDDDADMEDVAGGDEDDDDEMAGPKVRVGDVWYHLEDVTSDVVSRMTEAETDEFIRIGQEAHANMFA